MALPDVQRLLDYPAASWRALAKRLRDLGLTPARVAPIVHAVRGLHPTMRAPIRAHHLRRIASPHGHAMRMFLFSDPVKDEEARETLGAELDALLAIGLLERRPDGSVVSPFVMSLLNQLFILSDDLVRGGDGVMGFGDGTIELCRASFPDTDRRAALDLGCGAGTCAIALAAGVKRVVATDVNPRAMVLARVNTLLNGVQNVELREGDGFSPVKGDRFDLLVSQPPFVPLPEGSEAATFLYGGRRGDEMALHFLGQIESHLHPEGRAVLRVDWPEDDSPLAERLRAAAGNALDLLVLTAPRATLEEHATGYAAGIHPDLGPAYEAETARRLAHLTKAKIRGFSPSIVALQRPKGKAPRTEIVPIAPLAHAPVTWGKLDKLFAASALLTSRDRLLRAALSVPEGTVLAQEQSGLGPDAANKIVARFNEEACRPPMDLTPEQLFLATFIHETRDVRSGISKFAAETGVSQEEALTTCVPLVESALSGGLLEIRDKA